MEQRVQELEQAESDRKHNELKIRFLSSSMEQSLEGMAIADTEGVLINVNQTWAEMHGYESPKELEGKHLSIFHNPGQLKNDVEPFNAIVLKKDSVKGRWDISERMARHFPPL
ncbi:MAG: PAS domain S-box protein [Desulfobacterales bacterium]